MEKFEKSNEDQAWALFAAAALSGVAMKAPNPLNPSSVSPLQTATYAAGLADQMLIQFRLRRL